MKIAVTLLAIPGIAHAALCARIEYVEARDWSAPQIERAYCDASKAAAFGLTEARRLAVVEHDPQTAQITLNQANVCAEQQALFGRIIENVHKRPIPVCK